MRTLAELEKAFQLPTEEALQRSLIDPSTDLGAPADQNTDPGFPEETPFAGGLDDFEISTELPRRSRTLGAAQMAPLEALDRELMDQGDTRASEQEVQENSTQDPSPSEAESVRMPRMLRPSAETRRALLDDWDGPLSEEETGSPSPDLRTPEVPGGAGASSSDRERFVQEEDEETTISDLLENYEDENGGRISADLKKGLPLDFGSQPDTGGEDAKKTALVRYPDHQDTSSAIGRTPTAGELALIEALNPKKLQGLPQVTERIDNPVDRALVEGTLESELQRRFGIELESSTGKETEGRAAPNGLGSKEDASSGRSATAGQERASSQTSPAVEPDPPILEPTPILEKSARGNGLESGSPGPGKPQDPADAGQEARVPDEEDEAHFEEPGLVGRLVRWLR